MDHLSLKIRRLRELRNYSQDYLAESLQVSQQTYSRLERHASKMTLQRLQTVARILDFDLVQLLVLPLAEFDRGIPDKAVTAPILAANIQLPQNSLTTKIRHLEQELKTIKFQITTAS